MTPITIDTYEKADDAATYVLGLLTLLKKSGCLSGGDELTSKGIARFDALVARGFMLDREQIETAYAPFVVEHDRKARGVPVPEFENGDGHATGIGPILLVMEARGQIVLNDAGTHFLRGDAETEAAKTQDFDGIVDLILKAQAVANNNINDCRKTGGTHE